jgi:hypothetical protein
VVERNGGGEGGGAVIRWIVELNSRISIATVFPYVPQEGKHEAPV